MKKFFVVLIMLLCCVNFALAQKSPFFKAMKNVETINYTVDFSKTKIDKYSVEDYTDLYLGTTIEQFKAKVENLIVNEANACTEKMSVKLSNEEESDIMLKINLIDVDLDGEHTLVCKLFQKSTDGLISLFEVHKNGGSNDNFIKEFSNRISASGKEIGNNILKIKKASLKAK